MAPESPEVPHKKKRKKLNPFDAVAAAALALTPAAEAQAQVPSAQESVIEEESERKVERLRTIGRVVSIGPPVEVIIVRAYPSNLPNNRIGYRVTVEIDGKHYQTGALSAEEIEGRIFPDTPVEVEYDLFEGDERKYIRSITPIVG